MSATRIVELKTGIAKAYVLEGREGRILVDTGISGKAALRACGTAGIETVSLRLIVVTHAHADHFGGVQAIRAAAPGLESAMSRTDAQALVASGGIDVDLRPLGAKGSAAAFMVRVLGSSGGGEGSAPSPAFAPDLLLDGSEDLGPYGVDARLVATPGHTAGSVSILVPEAEDERGRTIGCAALAGDLVMGGFVLSWSPSPPFFGDMDAIRDSLSALKAQGVRRLFTGHGGPLDAQRVWRRFGL